MTKLSNEELFSRIVNSEQLPTLPEVAQRLIEIANQDEPDTDTLCQVIRSDPAISAKILKTTNSALFAFRPRVETIESAVPKLGTSMIRTLILSFHLSTFKSEEESIRSIFQDLWRCCLTQAVIAEYLAEKSGNDPAFCFLAGMLQDIGILAMLVEAPLEYRDNVLAFRSFPNVATAENEFFGFSHVDVTQGILKKWELEATFGNVIRHHHDAVAVFAKTPVQIILQAANLGAELMARGLQNLDDLESGIKDWFGFLGTQFQLDEDDFDTLVGEIHDRVDEYSAIFNFDIGEPVDSRQLISEAKDILHKIAMNNQLHLLLQADRAAQRRPDQSEIYRDCLTNLFNRRFVNEHLVHEVEKWIKKRKPVALMFIDADKFKQINDHHGHNAGDLAIKHIANWLQANIRSQDHAIRLGGDEFLIVMQIQEKHLKAITERISTRVPKLVLKEGKTVPVSLSIGCVLYEPDRSQAVSVSQLIDLADQLMYRVKRRGGSRLTIQKIENADRLKGILPQLNVSATNAPLSV